MAIKNEYNTLENLPLLQYNIISYLMGNNEDIWKILKYTSTSCLRESNLSLHEKGALIYGGQPDSSGYRVFMDSFMDDAFINECSILRIFPDVVSPKNRTVADLVVRIEVLSHVKIQYLDGYMNRNVYLLQQILKTLNGIDKIDGLGRLVFDKNDNTYDRATLNISNNRSFTGYSIVMSSFTT